MVGEGTQVYRNGASGRAPSSTPVPGAVPWAYLGRPWAVPGWWANIHVANGCNGRRCPVEIGPVSPRAHAIGCSQLCPWTAGAFEGTHFDFFLFHTHVSDPSHLHLPIFQPTNGNIYPCYLSLLCWTDLQERTNVRLLIRKRSDRGPPKPLEHSRLLRFLFRFGDLHFPAPTEGANLAEICSSVAAVSFYARSVPGFLGQVHVCSATLSFPLLPYILTHR